MLIENVVCLIKFEPKDKQQCTSKTFPTSRVELHKDNDDKYSLRGISLNDQREIFRVELDSEDVYKFGEPNKYDIVCTKSGFYCLMLNAATRDILYAQLAIVISTLQSSKTAHSPSIQSTNQHGTVDKLDDTMNLLFNINELNTAISEGNKDQARQAAQNVSQKIYFLKTNAQIVKTETKENEDPMKIQVQVDMLEDSNDNACKPFPVTVYPSTTVNQLRAVFASAYDYKLAKQCFFVNGHLAYGEDTMKELGVEQDTLFVLLLIP